MSSSLSDKFVSLVARESNIDSWRNYVREITQKIGLSYIKIVLKNPNNEKVDWQFRSGKIDEKEPFFIKKLMYQKKEIGELHISQLEIVLFDNYYWDLYEAVCIEIYTITNKAQRIDTSLLTRDLELASRMQRSLISEELFSMESFQAEGVYIPTFLVGGDFYDVIPITDHKVAFYIGDISGKGVNAAIVMANFQAIVRSILIREFSLEQTIDIINYKLYEMTHGEKFLTLFLGLYNAEDKRLIYINCGHVPPALYDEHSLQWLDKGTTVLGAFDQLPFIELGKVSIEKKKRVFLYTDGIFNLKTDSGDYINGDMIEKIMLNEMKNKSIEQVLDYFSKKAEHIDVSDDMKDDVSLLMTEMR